MRTRPIALLIAVFAAGCQGLGLHPGSPAGSCMSAEETSGAPTSLPDACPNAQGSEAPCPPSCPGPAVCAPGPPPQKPPCAPCVEYHVKVPRERAGVPRSVAAPQAVAEQQQVVTQQQVLLVPQRVLVPFVQTTNFGAIRVNGLQQTQVTNLLGVAATGEATAASGLAVGGAAGVTSQGLAAGAAESGLTRADVERINELLSHYEKRISELEEELKKKKDGDP